MTVLKNLDIYLTFCYRFVGIEREMEFLWRGSYEERMTKEKVSREEQAFNYFIKVSLIVPLSGFLKAPSTLDPDQHGSASKYCLDTPQ